MPDLFAVTFQCDLVWDVLEPEVDFAIQPSVNPTTTSA